MRLKTSTEIILKFQIFTLIIIFLILFILNAFYFKLGIGGFKKKSEEIINAYKTCNMPFCNINRKKHKIFLERGRGMNWNIVDKSGCFDYIGTNICLQNSIFENIYKVEDNYFYFYKEGIVFDITNFVEFQIQLLKISLYIIIFYIIVSYFVGYLFLQKVYKKIFKATKELEQNNYINLKEYNLAENDELKELFETINNQIDSINSFNKYLSHELKTPLMNISSTFDLLYEKYKDEKFKKIKNQIFYIKDIIDTLNKLILIENKKLNIDYEKINICYIVKKYYENIYCEEIIIKTNKELMDIVIKNLIDNAKKHGIQSINIQITEKYLKIENKTDKQLNIEKLTEKFYKQSENGLGLGLYLVDKITKILGYKLFLKQEGDNFIVYINF